MTDLTTALSHFEIISLKPCLKLCNRVSISLSQLQLQCSVSAVAEQLQCEVLLRTEEVVFF